MSTKAYDYFITGLSVFDAADHIRETINPVFFDAFREQLDLLDERLQNDAAHAATARSTSQQHHDTPPLPVWRAAKLANSRARITTHNASHSSLSAPIATKAATPHARLTPPPGTVASMTASGTQRPGANCYARQEREPDGKHDN